VSEVTFPTCHLSAMFVAKHLLRPTPHDYLSINSSKTVGSVQANRDVFGLSTRGVHVRNDYAPDCELLPHIFTLTDLIISGNFLLHCHTLASIFPLGNSVLCVVRTFLHTINVRRQICLLLFLNAARPLLLRIHILETMHLDICIGDTLYRVFVLTPISVCRCQHHE